MPEDEAYACNCIWMNDTIIVPEGYPKTQKAIEDKGFKIITVDSLSDNAIEK